MPELEPVDLVVTDPPYPKMGYKKGMFKPLVNFKCRQFIFWSAKNDFPLNYTAIHIWDKHTGCASPYERIFERNGNHIFKVYRKYYGIDNEWRAHMFCKDIFTGHPDQKPIKLILRLIADDKGKNILDPFMGSGTTLVAAKQLGRKSIGIEIEEKYCEIAVKRLSQEVIEWK